MNTLYVSDLDGTLLNSKSQISPKSLDILNQLIEEGMHFTYATARSLSSSSKVTAGLKKDIPVIIYNGAMIVNAKDGSILYQCTFTLKEREFIQNLFQSTNYNPIVYTFLDKQERVLWYDKDIHIGARKYIQSRKGDLRFINVHDEKDLYHGDIFYYTCIGDYQSLLPLYEQLKDNTHFTCTFQQELYSQDYWLEIMPKLATKANAIKKLKEIWECDYLVVFGDAINDIPMFEIADEAYAMKEAVEPLKAIATSIIQSHNEDGVAMWLKDKYNKRKTEV